MIVMRPCARKVEDKIKIPTLSPKTREGWGTRFGMAIL
jgi:hypothetical protein